MFASPSFVSLDETYNKKVPPLRGNEKKKKKIY